MSSPATGAGDGPGHGQAQAQGAAPGKGKAAIALAPAAKLEFWVRFMYYNPRTEKWDFIPEGVEAWIFVGKPDTACGDKVPTAAPPKGTHLEGPKPAQPSDVGFALNFGKGKAIDPAIGKLVDMEANKLLVPLPETWESTCGVFTTSGRAIYAKYDPPPGTVQGKETAPVDIMLPTQVVFYGFQFATQPKATPFVLPPAKVVRWNDEGCLPLAPEGGFFDTIYGAQTDKNKFGWKVKLDPVDGAPPKYDLEGKRLIGLLAGDPAPDRKFAYLKAEFDSSKLPSLGQILNGSLAAPVAQPFPYVYSPTFAGARQTPAGLAAFCGDQLKVSAGHAGIAADAEVKGETFSRAPDGKETKIEDLTAKMGPGVLQADWALKDVVKNYLKEENGQKPQQKTILARLSADGIKAHSNQTVLVQRVGDVADQGFTSAPSHACPGFAPLVPRYKGTLAGADLKLKVRVKYQVGYVRYFFTVNGALKYGKMGPGQKLLYHDTDGTWKDFTGDWDTEAREVVFLATAGKRVENGGANEWPWPADMPAYSAAQTQAVTDSIAAGVAKTKELWGGKFYVKRKDCKGAEDCCRWKIDVELSVSDAEASPDFEIVYIAGPGRANVTSWFTHDFWGSGPVTVKTANVPAHEVGHMMGAFDEYQGGGVNPDASKAFLDSGTLMHNLSDTVEARHMIDAAEFMKQLVTKNHNVGWEFEITKV